MFHQYSIQICGLKYSTLTLRCLLNYNLHVLGYILLSSKIPSLSKFSIKNKYDFPLQLNWFLTKGKYNGGNTYKHVSFNGHKTATNICCFHIYTLPDLFQHKALWLQQYLKLFLSLFLFLFWEEHQHLKSDIKKFQRSKYCHHYPSIK